MELSKILIIHPYDNSTSFLKRIADYLDFEFNGLINYLSVKPNELSHNLCLEEIRKHDENGLIIFLGHGRSDKLYGAKSDYYGKMLSYDFIAENEDIEYYNEDFINLTNCHVFKNKKIICFACNSNEAIAKTSIQFGAKTFVGFGDVPSSINEFKEKNIVVGDKVIAALKGEFNIILKQTLKISIKNNYDFDSFKNLFSLIANKRISEIIMNRKGLRNRRLIADVIYSLKKEMSILGDKHQKLSI